MKTMVITPPIADPANLLEAGLVRLTRAIFKLDKSVVGGGCLGGTFGYGAHWDNDVFMMHPYCWCERPECLWCTPWLSNEIACSEEDAEAHRAKQRREAEAIYGRGVEQAPNFWHKPSGLWVRWYKWIGRDMESQNPNGADVSAVLRECIGSLRKKEPASGREPLAEAARPDGQRGESN